MKVQRGVCGQRHAPAALALGNRPDTHCTGSWMGHQSRSGQVRRTLPPLGFDPRTVHPIARLYTDCDDIIIIIIMFLKG